MPRHSGESRILVRFSGEVAIKGASARRQFLLQLEKNIEAAAKRAGISVCFHKPYNRFLIETNSGDILQSILKRTFGVGTFSPIQEIVNSSLEKIVEAGESLFKSAVKGQTFAVRARKTGSHRFSSVDIERALGDRLRLGGGKVQLRSPEKTVYVEVLNEVTYLLGDKLNGPGGFPVGVQGSALALVSGGFDSVVAAWRMMGRGLKVNFLFFNLAGAAYERSVLEVFKVLHEIWGGDHCPSFSIIDFSSVVRELKSHINTSYRQVLLKRMMLKCAEPVAQAQRSEALVTGESVGQVSSQTLLNLKIIDEATDFLVLRPLAGMHKREIVDEARTIGTAVLSEKIREYCSLSQGSPLLFGQREKVLREEEKIDKNVLHSAVESVRQLQLAELNLMDMRSNYLFVDQVEESYTVIDCQQEHMFRSWHWPGSWHRLPEDLVSEFKNYDKSKSYLLYCTYGTQTPFLAEKMQRMGFEAYAFRGGISKLRKHHCQRA